MIQNPQFSLINFASNGGIAFLSEYDRVAAQYGAASARDILLAQLEKHSAEDWLACARAFTLRGDVHSASALLQQAISAFPESIELAHALSGIFALEKNYAAAERLLKALLERHPSDIAATFLLAKILKEQGKMYAVASVIQTLFEHTRGDIGTIIQAVELLDECGRKQEAARLCENEIMAGSTDARLYAYAGMLEMQLGNFDLARQRYLFTLAHSPRALDWQTPLALVSAQRYADSTHPDFALLHDCLQRTTTNDKTRASILFALGKAHDDIGDYATAALKFRDANAIVKRLTHWSRKQWRRAIEARLATRYRLSKLTPVQDFSPLFIVGPPRSGTTLVAELLARHPDVCNRGELAWLPFLAQRLSLIANPDESALRGIAITYLAQLRQDDTNARWMIDKQPLNFLNIDLIAALFPNARIIYCQRSSRDTALSIWAQYFSGHENDFAYDFSDIAALIQGCTRLMAHWRNTEILPIYTLRYEQLAADPKACIASLTEWLELTELDLLETKNSMAPIGTSSMWQVRQPIYSRSIGRWQSYAKHIPELTQLFAE